MTIILVVMGLIVVSAILLTQKFQLPRNIGLLFIAQPLVTCAAPIIVFIGGLLSSELTSNASLATLPITLMILGVAAASIPAAMIAKIKGRKFAVFTGFSCLLVASLFAILATKLAVFELFAVAGFLFGMGGSFTQQLRFAAIESVKNEEDIPKVLSILMLSGVFAAFLGPEIAVTAKNWLSSPHGYAGSFFLLALFICLAAMIMIFFKEPDMKQTSNNGAARPLSIIAKQPLFIIAICTATIGYALMSYLMTATPLSMHHMQGHSLNETKWVIQSHIAAMYLPSLLTPWLVKKIALKGLLFLGSFIYIVVAVIAFSGQEVMHYWWALILLGIGRNFLFLTGTSLLPQSYQPCERHKVQAANDFILFGFQAFASLMVGWVLFTSGWNYVVLTSLPFIVILIIINVVYFRYEYKQKNMNKLT
ncbi:MFS transporter [Colwellia sp. MSW7]|uniref:MFS transporter n=1 Tax=Colwellia maritima TaxID=2912588 RepID=A0ABS9X0Z1_9GAMM|nr:MFS transporter [Colwellia maritima]MCI2283861.1 MFS transporter [Colwellia maritima]